MSRSPRTSIALCALLAAALVAAPGAAAVKKRSIGRFDHPVYVTGAPGFPKLEFVVEQPGTVRVVKGTHKLRHPFLNIRREVGYDGAERGLLSIAFPPDYAQSGLFYVDYNDNRGDIHVAEFHRASATRAVAGSERTVLQINHRQNANHNGGQLQFLGNLLYVSTGDGGSGGDPPNNAQNLDSLLGKILRIDPRAAGGNPYTVPSDNPFVGRPGRDEIFSYGLRNPWRFSFDTGAGGPFLAIGDAGQDRFEEVDFTRVGAAAGANFGWDAFEGFAPYTGENSGTPDPGGTTKPIFVYGHGGGNCTIIGGYVVRDKRLRGLRGRYLYGDFCVGQIRSLRASPSRAHGSRSTGVHVDSLSSFGEDDLGRIYACSLKGPVYRLIPG